MTPTIFPLCFLLSLSNFSPSVKEKGTALSSQLLSLFNTHEMAIRVHLLAISNISAIVMLADSSPHKAPHAFSVK